jgi:hypothetical protein
MGNLRNRLRERRSLEKAMEEFAEVLMTPSPIFLFLKYGKGKCRVPGCGEYAGRKPLCRKHQHSAKLQKFSR